MGIDGGENHGIGLAQLGGLGLSEPGFELVHGVGTQGIPVQGLAAVFLSKVGDVHGNGN